jgi:hypothetical protein
MVFESNKMLGIVFLYLLFHFYGNILQWHIGNFFKCYFTTDCPPLLPYYFKQPLKSVKTFFSAHGVL